MKSKRTHRSMVLTILISTGLVVLGSVAQADDAASDGDPDSLFNLSIEELMDVEITLPATITEKNPLKTPASVTVITARDIALTPARNLMDLMEVYVPGFMYLNHSVGQLPGMRGVIVDRPYQYLINVNGINVNIKSHYGARLELLNWDLNDIERVEIIRGPGSVTYGPGAVGGVINIYTKKAKDNEGVRIGGRFWDEYNSLSQYVSYGRTTDKYNLFSYFSIAATDGTRPSLFGVGTSGAGYVGNPVSASSSPPATYLSDYSHEPQIKAHFDVLFKNNWRFWGRYVTANSALTQGSAVQYPVGPNGEYEDFRQTRYRYFQLVLENKSPLDEDFSLKTQFGISSIDVQNVEKYVNNLGSANSQNNLLSIGWMWSEYEYYTRFMLNYDPKEGRSKAAVGFELSYDTIGPAWGKNENNGLRMSSGIVSGPGSDAYGGDTDLRQVDSDYNRYFAVGNGWTTTSYAFLGEWNYQISPKLTSILSARLDKHTYTGYLFSPRAALVWEMDQNEYLKLIAQRSARMNTQEELYMSHELGMENKSEQLDTLEVIYSKQFDESLSFQSSFFYNDHDIIGWNWSSRRSTQIGNLKAAGVELEALYKKETYNIGINHTYVKQIDYKLGEGILVSGISYSDYYQDTKEGVIILSNGNDLNNWSNNITKLFANVDIMDGKFTLHGDMRTQWGFEGYKDGLDALEKAGGDADDIQAIRDQDAFDMQMTVDVSLTYHINKSSDLAFFVQNIPVFGENRRFSYSSGYKKTYPDKTSWIEEPTVFGMQYELRF